ncbi:MAG: hypothetical protein JSV89_05745 [Spirochaetaceae bacterium]|nr:MAG: hypothetical protein JSV89_05745 [Spirochaetaceae bacterium]
MKSPVLLLLLALILVGCDAGQAVLSFATIGEGERVVLRRLVADELGNYLLKEPVLVIRNDQAFYLRYRGGGLGSTLRVLGQEGRELTAKDLPYGAEAMVYLPMKRGQTVQGFRIDSRTAGGRLELLEAGIADTVSGFQNSGRLLIAGTTVAGVHRDGGVAELAVAAPIATETSGWQIAIGMETRAPFSSADFRLREALATPVEIANRTDPATPSQAANLAHPGGPLSRTSAQRTSILIHLRSGDQGVSFRHTALAGKHRLFLYHGLIPFTPESLRIEPTGGGAVWLESFEIFSLPQDRAMDSAASADWQEQTGVEVSGGSRGSTPVLLDPLPADPGAVLLYDPTAWRQPDYELFAWSRFPDILIMDTASYQVQSRYFKRLAFFVEKRGYRGRLVSNQEFAGLHGFNAHDYRAEDLARFFQTAREELFALNPEEEHLKQILLANGIIRDEGVINPGKGGILSISRSSYPILRRHLLTHECWHGLFFSQPEFRKASFEAWDRLSERERDFWRLLFRWVGYDTEDPYLAVNEYQAYLFQQPRAEVPYYFTVLTAARLISSYPDQAVWIGEFIRSDPDSFTRAFDRLETDLLRIAGMEGGRAIEFELAELK